MNYINIWMRSKSTYYIPKSTKEINEEKELKKKLENLKVFRMTE